MAIENLALGDVVSKDDVAQLGLEVVSREARLRLTRLLRDKTAVSQGEDPAQITLINRNRVINLANTATGRPIYVLRLDDWDYAPAEYAWHNAELELILRRPETPDFAVVLADLVQESVLSAHAVNRVLREDQCSFQIEYDSKDRAYIELDDLGEVPELANEEEEHENLRTLFERMDRAMAVQDWSLVVHTGASIFETLAKQVVPNPNVQNQSLGGWFSLYRNHSQLAEPLLDVIQDIFNRRNVEPLAGHGSVTDPSITREEAIQIQMLSQTLVRLERALASDTAV